MAAGMEDRDPSAISAPAPAPTPTPTTQRRAMARRVSESEGWCSLFGCLFGCLFGYYLWGPCRGFTSVALS